MSASEWFDRPDPTGRTRTGEVGLRFTCTSCGACCTGPEGYVNFTEAEGRAIADRLGISHDEFLSRYTHDTIEGRSLTERRTEHGFDCVFLDREAIPGKAICAIYEDRPRQCRTWPFWEINLRSPRHWEAASRGCPGMDTGELHSPAHVRLTRERDAIG
jgi:hypothetical protein